MDYKILVFIMEKMERLVEIILGKKGYHLQQILKFLIMEDHWNIVLFLELMMYFIQEIKFLHLSLFLMGMSN